MQRNNIDTIPEDFFLNYEKSLWKENCNFVAGVDEAGRGPLAGPVVAAAVVFKPFQKMIPGVQDSKKISPRKRIKMKSIIDSMAVAVGIGIVSEKEIDRLNILRATLQAMRLSVESLRIKPDYLIIDGRNTIDCDTPQMALIRGDSLSLSVAAASIIAKVTRDKIMIDYEEKFPLYGFAKHKGYPTKMHISAIQQYGFCQIHRRSFKPKALAYTHAQ